MKWIKFIIAILLLPVCIGAVEALFQVLHAIVGEDSMATWVAVCGGAASWLVVYSFLPKPMLIYVFGHELTHALWTWLFGGKVKKFKASSSGGHVVVTKNNFLITLAPYFFPVYAVLVIVAFLIGHLIWNWMPYLVWFHLSLGAAYAFHLTLTWHILKTEQSDITQHGYIFSAVIILIGNIIVLMLGVPLLGSSRVGILTAFHWWFDATVGVVQRMEKFF
jgi:hypothetical protein